MITKKLISMFKLMKSEIRWYITHVLLLYTVFVSVIHVCDTPEVFPSIAGYNPCCSYPCLNGGVCLDRGDSFICDCSNTGYYGRLCATESWDHLLRKVVYNIIEISFYLSKKMRLWNEFSCELFSSIVFWFYIPATIENMRSNILFDSSHEIALPANTFRGKLRILPPVPKHCPTILGTKGLKEMPDIDDIYQKLLKRDNFKRNRQGLNLLFASYGLHLNLQFSSRSSDINMISCAHIYEEIQRSYKSGMMKTEIIKNEEYPVFRRSNFNWIWDTKYSSSVQPNIFTYAMTTIWVREHNRVCNLLVNHWRNWDDELLYQTAKKIITGEMLVISMTEWLSLFGGYKIKLHYKPQFAQYGSMVVANSLPLEVYLTLLWPSMLPDNINLQNKIVNLSNAILHKVPNLIQNAGIYETFKMMASTEIGMMSAKNSADSISEATITAIADGRNFRLPSLNQYRTRLGLTRMNDFSYLTSSRKIVAILKKLYGDIDHVEFIPGVFIEESKKGAVGETLNTLFSNWLFKSLITHPLGSKQWWKPNFMGGNLGWDIVQRANLIDLICLNVNESNLCYDESKIGFRIPKISRFMPRIKRKTDFTRKQSIFAKKTY
ncbi:hypothetical protein O3M35_004718 [Rhynocoris fuscipes]|uniref:prostaglandin-endoperoxide synthase n=1 Tax=Rhynocoris fuscipes TaxID=488301 RepID=A0AAW1CGG3_9HEMI